MKEQDEKFLLCSCGSDGMLITHIEYETMKESGMEVFAKEFEFAIFRNYTYKPNLWERIKYAWYHLRTGKKHEDQIILDYDNAGMLISFLIKKMKEKKFKNK